MRAYCSLRLPPLFHTGRIPLFSMLLAEGDGAGVEGEGGLTRARPQQAVPILIRAQPMLIRVQEVQQAVVQEVLLF